MAVGRPQPDVAGVQCTSFGTYTVSGDDQPRLTITSDLDEYDFPNGAGSELRVELVEYDDQPNVLELIPCEGGDE